MIELFKSLNDKANKIADTAVVAAVSSRVNLAYSR